MSAQSPTPDEIELAITSILDMAQQQAVDLIHDYKRHTDDDFKRVVLEVEAARDAVLKEEMQANTPFALVVARAIEAMFAVNPKATAEQ